MSVTDDLRRTFLTSSLSDDQLGELVAVGEERAVAAGERIFREGEPATTLWILLEGRIELSRRIGDQSIVVATMDEPGRWAGGLSAWGGTDDHAVTRATGVAVTDCRIFAVPSSELGRLVGEWSPFAKHMITGVYQTIRSIDANARQRESLVALGTLAAGLAHEINNPASASMRAVESLQRTSGYMIGGLIGLAEQQIRAEQFLEIERMRHDLQDRSVDDAGPLARADREEALGEWMEHRGIELAWVIAPVLAEAGADRAWLDELDAVLGGPDVLAPALRWMSAVIGCQALLTELADATARISHLVEDVKNYSQMDRAALQSVDLSTGIDSTLAMLAPKLQRITVVREYGDVPAVEVYAAELNQVWTNLIDNAIDAMDGEGTLRISTSLDGGHVVVRVSDTGRGVDPDVATRVFEPFFTTKDVGKGTGLGLDISRRIVVDRHGGDISLSSETGTTVATVRLPIHR